MGDPEIVVIGAGVAGGALATVMARSGRSVLLLEITPEHRDVVRGEFLANWGVAEAQTLGLYELYVQAGAHCTDRLGFFDEDLDPAMAEAQAIDFATVPLPRPLALGHPRLCTILDDAAVSAGASFLRGVRRTHVTPGSPPVVTFEHQGGAHEIRPRLVVAADGRHGQTRRQVGIPEEADPVHHWNMGVLVDGLEDWPENLDAIGVEDWRSYFIFPQGQGRARVYVCVNADQRERMMGPEGPQNMLTSFDGLCSAPLARCVARGRPAGPAFGYPNNDTWTKEPYTEGVVLIGDAAGHNDPIIGQGLSIAHRDVRLVSDVLNTSEDWSASAFKGYGEERGERMRRLRNIGRLVAIRDAEFTSEARARRARAAQRLQERPEFVQTMMVPVMGPDAFPAEVYAWETVEALLA
jgi:2-polyprenyl-6-methoxyphenol hydroxylase-like FAD-dependent oxidoreductase